MQHGSLKNNILYISKCSAMGVVVFECQRCGHCCRHLLEDINGVTNGLFLTIKEKKLFPRELVFPQRAMGLKGPNRVISYQLSLDRCPYINDQNQCEIYSKRPLACRAFPYIIEDGKPKVSTKCQVIGSQMDVREYRVVNLAESEVEASWKIERYLQNRYKQYSKRKTYFWEYDLKSRIWYAC